MEPLLEDVFKLSGVPSFTFVAPSEYDKLLLALRTPGRGLVIEGPSGIGKTTAVRMALGDLEEENRLPYPGALTLTARRPDDVEFLSRLHEMGSIGMVVIDDFHRLSDETRTRLTDLLKSYADEERTDCKLILIGISKAGDALIRVAPDISGRLDQIRFGPSSVDRVEAVLRQGAEALNTEFPELGETASSACGSFFVAQMLGRNACLGSAITEKLEEHRPITKRLEAARAEIFAELDRTFFGPTGAFCRGHRLRARGRAPYMRLLYWLAESESWFVSIPERLAREPEYRASVGQIAEKGYIEQLIEANDEVARVLSWDQASQVLTVEDPQYVFYLKNILWSKYPRRLGYRSVSFPPPGARRYDVALSFAGSDRYVAEALFEELTRRDLTVFYDQNEESRILGESVEDYLAPIYESESAFVVVLLGPDYPTRVWTKFESDHFEARFGENAVIPVWFSDAPAQMFDRSRRVGGLTFDRDGDLEAQASAFSDAIERKLEEVALLAADPTQERYELEDSPTRSV
jgi:hypothetical protein